MRAEPQLERASPWRRALIRCTGVVACFAGGWLGLSAYGGGAGLNTVVVVNQQSSNSVALGNYYCERRGVPPENLLRIQWPGGNVSWNYTDFQTSLLQPLLDAVATRQLSNQVDYVVLSMDIPFQTVLATSTSTNVNATTSVLFYGFKPEGGTNWSTTFSSYAASERAFRSIQPASGFLATMITGRSLAEARQLVDQGVNSDAQYPPGKVVLQKTSDPLRNIRYSEFDDTIFNVRLRGLPSILRTNSNSLPLQTNLLGYQTGLAQFAIPTNVFLPGSLADSFTSYGGVIFGPNSQTNILAFVAGGVAGTCGTVAEPYSTPNRFPNSQVYFYQARGFGLAESYYQSLNEPFLSLILGDPLTSPFEKACQARWAGLDPAEMQSGVIGPRVVISGCDDDHPIQQIDLFIDGKFYHTLTNTSPAAGNSVQVSFNGFPVSYTVPPNASLSSMAADLAAAINQPEVTNLTRVVAGARGDRIELQCLDPGYLTKTVFVPVPAPVAASGASYRLSYLPEDSPPRLAIPGFGPDGSPRLQLGCPANIPYVVEASTNLSLWTPIYTNFTAGLVKFVDHDATNYPSRFYRVYGRVPDPRPSLAASIAGNNSMLNLRASSGSSQPYVLEGSVTSGVWFPVLTNLAGGDIEFQDSFTNHPGQFYRAEVMPSLIAPPNFAPMTNSTGAAVLAVTQPTLPFLVECSTNQQTWLPLATNYAISGLQVTVASSQGAAPALTTYLTASRSKFLSSEAFGIRDYTLQRTPALNSWLQLTMTRTNGSVVSVAVTNQVAGATITDLSRQLADAVNAAPALQGADGLRADDLTTDMFGDAHLNVYARSPGIEAGGFRVRLDASSPLRALPAGLVGVTNVANLRPRNHLYFAAGLENLTAKCELDTTALPDGFHELTAVGYDGSSVRGQSRASVTVCVSNSPLAATLELLDLPDGAPAGGTYHARVSANTASVAVTHLFSTGGWLASVTNQPAAEFSIAGSFLGAGRHPFFAIVETTGGQKYRTQTIWRRLVSSP